MYLKSHCEAICLDKEILFMKMTREEEPRALQSTQVYICFQKCISKGCTQKQDRCIYTIPRLKTKVYNKATKVTRK